MLANPDVLSGDHVDTGGLDRARLIEARGSGERVAPLRDPQTVLQSGKCCGHDRKELIASCQLFASG
jgi:hypothetical protein